MKRTSTNAKVGPVSEMAIVDTFTKLIFGEETQYSNRELKIIQAFRAVDHNVVLDSHRDMGAYLRALGVGEMIDLVSQVQAKLQLDLPVMGKRGGAGHVHTSVLDRRIH